MSTGTPQSSWDNLVEGNRRFANGTPTHPHATLKRREELVSGQAPFAAVLGCGDSRVPVEALFDAGLGDIFVCRTAGQVLDTAVLGTLEYAVGDVKVSVLIVLGHSRCGAVTAAVETERTHTEHPATFVRELLARIHPAVDAAIADEHLDVPTVGRHHVINTVDALVTHSPVIAKALQDGTLGIIGATYELETGQVVPIIARGPITLAESALA